MAQLGIMMLILYTENVTLMHTASKSIWVFNALYLEHIFVRFDITYFRCLFQFYVWLVDFHNRLAYPLRKVVSVHLYLQFGKVTWIILDYGVTNLSVCTLITYLYLVHLFFLSNYHVPNHHNAGSLMSFIIKTFIPHDFKKFYRDTI